MGEKTNLKHIHRNREIHSPHKGETYHAYPLVKSYQVFKDTEILSSLALCC